MKVSELLATISANMPSDVEDGSIINWINYLEDDLYGRIIGSLKSSEPFIDDDGLGERLRYKPELKTLATAEQDDLSIKVFGTRWVIMYEYYIYAQISILKEEFGKANNYIMLYNGLMDDFFAFYNSRYTTDRDWR